MRTVRGGCWCVTSAVVVAGAGPGPARHPRVVAHFSDHGGSADPVRFSFPTGYLVEFLETGWGMGASPGKSRRKAPGPAPGPTVTVTVYSLVGRGLQTL
jgi:hypothetical protein